MFTTSLVKRHRRRPRWLCHFNRQEQGRLQLVHQFNDSKQIKLKCTSRAHKQAQVEAKSFSQQHANHVQVQARSSAKYNKQHERIQLWLFPRQTRRSGFQALSALEHYQQHETFASSCNPTGAQEEPMEVAEHMMEPMDVVANECSTLIAPSFIFVFKNNFDKRSQTGFQKQQANYA